MTSYVNQPSILIFMLILYSILFCTHCIQAIHYIKKILNPFKLGFVPVLVLNFIVISCIYLQVPLFFMYIFFIVLLTLTFRLKGEASWYTVFFGVIVFTIHMALIHLMTLGVLGIAFSLLPSEIELNFLLYWLSFLILIVVATIVLHVIQKVIPAENIVMLIQYPTQMRNFIVVGAIILSCILFDTFIVFYAVSVFVNLYLIAGSIICGSLFYFFMLHSLRVAKASANRKIYEGLVSQMQEKQSKNAHLSKLAYLDTMTGLYNRVYIHTYIQNLIKQHAVFSIIYIDFNYLKKINDTLGHQLGDAYIQFVIKIIKKGMRREDKMGRIGGDEFLLVILNCTEKETEAIAKRITKDLSKQKFEDITPSISYGIAVFHPTQPIDFETLLQNADQKMYQYKQKNRESLVR